MGNTWNDIPFDNNATPEQKADEFDRQFAENAEAAYDKADRGEFPYENGSEVK